MKKFALAGLFSIFLLNVLSTSSIVGGPGGPRATPFEIIPDVYQKYAQQQAAPEPKPPMPGPPKTFDERATGQAPLESRPPAVSQAAPEPRPSNMKKHGSAKASK
jgi:hypothetical protein